MHLFYDARDRSEARRGDRRPAWPEELGARPVTETLAGGSPEPFADAVGRLFPL
jgi:hypothetical protein